MLHPVHALNSLLADACARKRGVRKGFIPPKPGHEELNNFLLLLSARQLVQLES